MNEALGAYNYSGLNKPISARPFLESHFQSLMACRSSYLTGEFLHLYLIIRRTNITTLHWPIQHSDHNNNWKMIIVFNSMLVNFSNFCGLIVRRGSFILRHT